MNIRKAQTICRKIDAQYERLGESVAWEDVYDSEQEMIDDLKKVYIPKDRVAPNSTFIGYEYIYSFAYYVQKGWTLSEKQMKQCKRLAKEIKKASAIAECYASDIEK